jgi:uncharacterized protein YlxW (UPF0749 family)
VTEKADEEREETQNHDSPGSPRRRTGTRAQVTAAMLLAVLGFAAVVQVQAVQSNDDYEGMREEDLVQLLNSLSAASQRAENEIAELEQRRSSLRSDTDSRAAILEQARQQAAVLGILAGTVPATGPGLVVRVSDPEGAMGINQLLDGLEELRNAGAEAIEINDSVRVVAQTALEDGEDGIIVDGRQVVAPYTIEVIGDPHTLAQSLNFTGGFVEDIEGPSIGGSVVIDQVEAVEIATLAEPREPEYAQPVE